MRKLDVVPGAAGHLVADRLRLANERGVKDVSAELSQLVPDERCSPSWQRPSRPEFPLLDLTGYGWPPVTRLIVRRERPHLGAQLSLSDIDSYRFLKPSGADCVAHQGEPRAATDRFARGVSDDGAHVIGTTMSLCPHGARGDGWEHVFAAQRRYSGRS